MNTQEKVRNILLAELAENKEDFNEYLKLVEIMKDYEGKKITVHLQKKLPDGFILKKGFSSWEIESPRKYKELHMNGANKTHYLCRYELSNNFKLLHFEDANSPYSKGAPERIKKITDILADKEKTGTILIKYSTLLHAIEKLRDSIKSMDDDLCNSLDNPAHYDILRELNIPTNILDEVKNLKTV